LGYDSIDELMKINISNLYSQDTSREGLIKKLLKTGEQQKIHLNLVKKDGTNIIVICSVRVVYDEFGDPKWLDGVIEEEVN